MPEDKNEAKSTEYPKSLHQGGDRNAAHVVVNNEDEERDARKGGHKMIDNDADKASVERLGGGEAAPGKAPEPAPAAPARAATAPKKPAKAPAKKGK